MPSNAAALADGAAADGAVDAGALALGDDAVVPQAAKTTANDAANTAPLIDHLFGVWDMLPVSSSGAPGADRLPPCPAAGACLFPAEANAPGASRRKPSISATERHAPEIAPSGRGRRRVQESAEPAGHVVEAPGPSGVERVLGVPLDREAEHARRWRRGASRRGTARPLRSVQVQTVRSSFGSQTLASDGTVAALVGS